MNHNPFIPFKKADLLIVDGRYEYLFHDIKEQGIKIIPTIKCEELYEAISYHPDILVHPISHDKLIVAPNVYNYFKDALKSTNIKVISGEKKLNRNYPSNIAYNVARVKNYAIHNMKYTDEKLMYYLKKEGIEFINVKQGYSKCSIAILSDDLIITADPSIYKKCIEKNLEVLKIESGYIALPGLDYGFIGGATGLLSKDKIMFSGTYDNHPNYKDINKILEKNNIVPIILSKEKIIDIGSIIPLKYI